MNQLGIQSKGVVFWDKMMFLSFCALVYFLPISIALTESFAGCVLFCFLVKKGLQVKDGRGLTNKEKGAGFFAKAITPNIFNVNFFIFLWVLISLFSVIASINGALSIKAFFTKMLELVCIYYFFIHAVTSKKRIRIIVSVFAVSFFLICLAGLHQYVYGFDFIRHKELFDMRVRSTFQAPTDFASYIVMISPMFFAVSMFLNNKKNSSNAGRYERFLLSKSVKIVLFLIFSVGLILLGFSYSRVGWMAMSIGLIIVGLFRKKVIVPIVVFILLFAAIFIPKMVSERALMDKSLVFSSYGRMGFWAQTLKIVEDRPILGTGIGTFTLAAEKYELANDYYPHNSYLHMASEIGIFGVTSFMGIIFFLLSQGFRSLKKIDDSWMRMLLLGILAGLSGFLIHSFFDTFFYSVQLSLLMWMMMGLSVAIQKVNVKEGALL